MKKSILLTLLLVITSQGLLLACINKKKVSEIQLTRTPCFGTCPWYKIVISEDGNMRYEGLKFVKNEGDYKGNINAKHKEELKEVFKYANEIKVDTFKDKYDAGIPDLPGLKLLFINSKGKVIKDIQIQGAEPIELSTLAEKIDALISEENIPTELPIHDSVVK